MKNGTTSAQNVPFVLNSRGWKKINYSMEKMEKNGTILCKNVPFLYKTILISNYYEIELKCYIHSGMEKTKIGPAHKSGIP